MSARVYECLKYIGEKIIENREYLTNLDREIGDADHGVNMARGYTAVIEKADTDNPDIGGILKKAGMTLLSTVGGASGPLYGTVCCEPALERSTGLKEDQSIQDNGWKLYDIPGYGRLFHYTVKA